jgi:hypothetical protein
MCLNVSHGFVLGHACNVKHSQFNTFDSGCAVYTPYTRSRADLAERSAVCGDVAFTVRGHCTH